MINKYKPGNNVLREYQVSGVKQGTAKNGSAYTLFTILDKLSNPQGNKKYESYTVFSWQADIRLADGDKITLDEIKSLEVKEREYNGKIYIDKTIFADISVISQNPNKVEVVGDLPNLNEINSDSLPF